MNVEEWLEANGPLLESPWERLFARAVLARVKGLDFRSVLAQWEFQDGDGHRRRADFVIDDGNGIRIVIEVMGLQATPVSQRDFVTDSKKAIALVSQGWFYLPVANSVFGAPGPGNEPVERTPGAAECTRAIELVTEQLRQHRAAAAESEGLRARLAATELDLKSLRTQRAQAIQSKANAEAEVAALRQALSTAEQGRRDAIEEAERRIAEASTQLRSLDDEIVAGEDDARRIADEISERDQARATAARSEELEGLLKRISGELERTRGELRVARDRADRHETQRRSEMKWAITAMSSVAAVAILSAAVLAVVFLMSDRDKDEPETTPTPATTTFSSPACEGVLLWGDAASCEGKGVTVKGPVVGASYQPSESGSPTFINLGNDFPSRSRLQVTIWGRCRDNFPAAPEDAFKGKVLYVTGTVEVRKGVPQIEVCSPDQISVE